VAGFANRFVPSPLGVILARRGSHWGFGLVRSGLPEANPLGFPLPRESNGCLGGLVAF